MVGTEGVVWAKVVVGTKDVVGTEIVVWLKVVV